MLSVSLVLQLVAFCLAITLWIRKLPDTDISEQFHNVAFMDAYQPDPTIADRASSVKRGCLQLNGEHLASVECPDCMRWLNDILTLLALCILTLCVTKSTILALNVNNPLRTNHTSTEYVNIT